MSNQYLESGITRMDIIGMDEIKELLIVESEFSDAYFVEYDIVAKLKDNSKEIVLSGLSPKEVEFYCKNLQEVLNRYVEDNNEEYDE